ncbi:terminase large subunit [Staphylococcus phage vB_SepS_SEP9]|uniref:Terminase large subunit n=2 Tax=Sextaecvirus TaxID=1922243 RepID=W5RV59_9CAUD|nr:terminase large subunit [Staphylococcus phage vB_SepS_SEP9]AHG23924.1 terminase large subunit [Staphylococcus phage vB_SepS_SEP9]
MNEDVISGRYIKKECSKFLHELENDESRYFFDVDMLETLDSLTKLINMADGMKEGVSAYEALGGFQWYFLANVLCWKYKENPKRRKYEKSLLLIGRKNGKTFLTGLIFLIFMMIEPEYSKFFSVSATKDLSSLIKEQMEMLLDKSPVLSNHFKWLRSEVRFTAKKSSMKPLAYSLDKLDGRKAAVWLSDETGALPSRYPIDSMRSSQMNQLNKTGIIISTAYQTTDNPMTEEVDYAEKVMDGIIQDDKTFALLYKPDNPKEWMSEEALYQANPILYDVPENYEMLDDERTMATEMPSKKSNFLTKHLNIFIDGDIEESFVTIDDLRQGKIAEEDFDWDGREVYLGIDLAETVDNTAVSMVYYDNDEDKFYTKCWSFIPQEKATEKSKRERINYFLMRDKGWAFLCGDRVISQRFVEDYVLGIEKKYNVIVKGIGYDRRNAISSVNRFIDEGDYECVEVRQNSSSLGPTFKMMRDYIIDGNFLYQENELLENNYKNARITYDTTMNIYVNKKKSAGKIDGVYATADAMYLWKQDIDDGLLTSSFEDRGLFIL